MCGLRVELIQLKSTGPGAHERKDPHMRILLEPQLSGKRILIGAAILLLSSAPTFAVDAQSFGGRLQTALKQQGISLSFSGVEEEGDDVLVKGAVVSDEDGQVEMGDLRFEDVTGSAERGFKAKRLPIPKVEKENAATSWMVSNIVLEDIQLAGTDSAATTPLPTPFYYGRFAADEFTTSRGGKNDFRISGTEIVNTVGDGGQVTSALDLGKFEVDLSLHEPTDFLRAVEEIGYSKFSGSGSGKATWDPRTGELRVDPLQLRIEDSGTFTFSWTVLGATRAFGESLADFLADDDPSTISVLAPVSHLSLGEFNGSYEDASLSERLVDFYASRENMPREKVKADAKTILPPLLRGLENKGFQEAIGSAVSDFLMDPQNKTLSVSIQPERPIPGAVVLGVAIGSPETLPDVLDVQIKADHKAR